MESNIIGLTTTGVADPEGYVKGNNEHGIYLTEFAQKNRIGGSVKFGAGVGNYIGSNGKAGIALEGLDNLSEDVRENSIIGNKIGIDSANGAAANQLNGILLITSYHTTIEYNHIGNNLGSGISLEHTSTWQSLDNLYTFMRHNRIGLDPNDVPAGNQGHGISLSFADLNVMEHNVIGSNTGNGIYLRGGFYSYDVITGNHIYNNDIGLGKNSTPRGNGLSGIYMTKGSDNNIGDPNGGKGNRIANNGGSGIWFFDRCVSHGIFDNEIFQNQEAGIKIGYLSVDNSILDNRIYNNQEIGIDLQFSSYLHGVTYNDVPFDPDLGGNNLQNFPVLYNIYRVPNSQMVFFQGLLQSEKLQDYLIQVFYNPFAVPGAMDPTNYGEGHTFIHEITVQTDANGDGYFNFLIPLNPSIDHNTGGFTATATEIFPFGNSINPASTSEFSYFYHLSKDGETGKRGSLTSVESNESSPQMELYPNPVKDKLHLHWDNAYKGPVEVSIRTSTGALVQQESYQKAGAAWNHSLDVSELSPGFYWIEIQDEMHQVTRSFVKK